MNEPEKVKLAHDAFIEAGSQVITVNSYAVVPFHLGDTVFAERGSELAGQAAKLARASADASAENVRVAGCLPPACGSYIPEEFDPEKAQSILSVLVSAMEEDVDFWLAETMSSLEEARVTSDAVRASDKPLWIAFTLRDDADAVEHGRTELRSGETVAEAASFALDAGAEAILFNCSMPEVMEKAISVVKSQLSEAGSDMQIGVYANAFAAPSTDEAANEVISVLRDDLDPTGYTVWVDRWVAAGASLIGGCCGITSLHIKALSEHRV